MTGAGVLALPTVSDAVGWAPATLALAAVWAYMVATALLLAELSVNTACVLGRSDPVSILSLAARTLPRPAAAAAVASYAALHYAILTAYSAQAAVDTAALLRALPLPLSLLPSLPPTLGFTALMAALCALPPRAAARVNTLLVAAALAALALLLADALPLADATRLMRAEWHALLHTAGGALLPVLLVSCVFHNVVPVVTMRLEGHRRRVRRCIVLGSAAPALLFAAYDAAVLSAGGANASLSASASAAAPPAALFGLLAVATSYVGFVQGLTPLWADARRAAVAAADAPHRRVSGAMLDVLLTVAPPALLAALWPHAVLRALDAAGTLGVAVLFGVLPPVMVWRARRASDMTDMRRFVAGGDAALFMLTLPPLFVLLTRAAALVADSVAIP
eukprot:gb/GEZJ01001931.1/.p1 GENE.gb/GEZJ01001931.1/~~gb/GEZJ01001931.1/.p1  ORF type:complete len:393 (-),score=74.48 gb/GEZJ01001931.1/:182-1360(-)